LVLNLKRRREKRQRYRYTAAHAEADSAQQRWRELAIRQARFSTVATALPRRDRVG
jgi:hypothetical protein